MAGLQDYLLYPYLQYEDFRFRRAKVSDEEMVSFLDEHRDWAFTSGLKKTWLRTLGKKGRWDSLIRHAPGSKDTEIQCYLATARIKRGQTADLLPVAQGLWTVGKSQPDACDPVFSWLKKEGGITPGLAWERIRRAMDAREPRLTRYLARFLSEKDQAWADLWYEQDRRGYRHLGKAVKWQDQQKSRDITSYGLRRLARNDSDRAWKIYQSMSGHFKWTADVHGGILREIALWSAVENADGTPERMQAVPDTYRDGKLVEWWVRFELSRENWKGVTLAMEKMPADQKDDSRWRYWNARALMETGEVTPARKQLGGLALEANYYGFLSADQMDLPYTICPQEPEVALTEVEDLRSRPGFQRALELRKAGIQNWSRSEWRMATRGFENQELRAAAALAIEEDWPDMAIFALGNSGDLRWYEWRFPVAYAPLVYPLAEQKNLDPAWVLGLMRSESAMAPDAMSPVGARGLMQIMPGTARQLAKRHTFNYAGKQQLMEPQSNIQFGTAYLRDLLDRFGENEVLASGAYNAGPNAVDRWVAKRTTDDTRIWVDTLPYHETREYIPRVLAFSTLYDWRLGKPVSRVSSRMPSFTSNAENGVARVVDTADVVCKPRS